MTSKPLDVIPEKRYKIRRYSRLELRRYSLDVIPAHPFWTTPKCFRPVVRFPLHDACISYGAEKLKPKDFINI